MKASPAPILLVMTGHVLEPIKEKFGDFDTHFANHIPTELIVYAICDMWPSTPLPDPSQFSGIIFSGSPAMLDEQQPWMLAAMDFVRQALRLQIPLLGICFGHQLLGAACGAKVGPNPNGRAFGTRTVTQHTSDDPLLRHLPSQFAAQVSHRDVILEQSPLFTVVGTAPHDPFHMIRVGSSAWGVQFHPEWDMVISQNYLDVRRPLLSQELGDAVFEHAQKNLTTSEQATSLLPRFFEYCCMHRRVYS